MVKAAKLALAVLALCAPPIGAPRAAAEGTEFRALCWHDVPARAEGDEYAVSLDSFVRQLDYLRGQGCSFVSVDRILRSSRGAEPLPGKAVLLTFDDAYESFYTNVFPILKARGYPCALAVVASWPDYPEGRSERVPRLMSWAQIKEVSDSGLVEIASHSRDGHRAIVADPYGSTAPALAARAYDISARAYEAAEDYEARVLKDLRSSARVIEERVGRSPRVLVWPYGRYTQLGISLAERAGFSMQLTLDSGVADSGRLDAAPRTMVAGDPSIESFARDFAGRGPAPAGIGIVQADLDLVYDPDPRACARNVNAFVDRMARIRPSVVCLQAFADEAGDGVVSSVYFPTDVLPVRSDLFGRVCRALSLKGIRVYAWMPMLGVKLPDDDENQRLRVRERRGGKESNPSAWYSNRLSPFSEEAIRKLEELYEDLASTAMIDGVLFQDDGYLSDFEDFSSSALASYELIAGDGEASYDRLSIEQKRRWTELKTDKLLELTDRLEAKVRQWRPTAAFARCLYARTVLEPESEEWYAQNFRKSLESYDYVAIMAYPDMEGASDAGSWLRDLVGKAASYPGGLERTIFKTQAYDWSGRRWLAPAVLGARIAALRSAGAINVGYYPDDYTVDGPGADLAREILSTGGGPSGDARR